MITISTLTRNPTLLSKFAYKFLSLFNALKERNPIDILQLGS